MNILWAAGEKPEVINKLVKLAGIVKEKADAIAQAVTPPPPPPPTPMNSPGVPQAAGSPMPIQGAPPGVPQMAPPPQQPGPQQQPGPPPTMAPPTIK